MVPIMVVAAVVAAVVGWQVVPHVSGARAGSPPSVATGSPMTGSTTSAGPSASTKATVTDRVTAELRGCRAKVADADAVLAAARTGIGHWDAHVEAQTDANEGRIAVAEMDDVFARTRLAGPEDQDRYRKALDRYADADGSCFAVAGTSRSDAAAFARCREHASAQRPVLSAAEPAMADWKRHLAAMEESRAHRMDDAEQIWIDAWRAAPPHLEAYADAAEDYDPPDC